MSPEQPARLTLDDHALLAEWKHAYRRGFAMQAPFAVLGFLLGLAAWWQMRKWGFMIGALAMIANVPWTLVWIMPTNHALGATEIAAAGPAARALIVKWSSLHAVRTALGLVATLAFFWACYSG
jgi:hypothetical protein